MKFYILDLTLNRNRFDSWVGCALSLADEIEQYSSPNCQVFYSSTEEMLLLGEKVFRCFNEAIRLKDNRSKVWYKYGKCAYNIASYISRIMKLGTVLENSQKVEMNQQHKRFLDQAQVCFESTSKFSKADEIRMAYNLRDAEQLFKMATILASSELGSKGFLRETDRENLENNQCNIVLTFTKVELQKQKEIETV
ncbi:calcineurin-binding protein cabin-1-like [Panonychus citri]|uniref:calcineurin-binding protein cabin-1-like n=1 Tax=Panonychus citri TaxID=50023 RepID=UPI002307D494|nr:calcineurin-binding protein cabin-1-like [Panonychus citri]